MAQVPDWETGGCDYRTRRKKATALEVWGALADGACSGEGRRKSCGQGRRSGTGLRTHMGTKLGGVGPLSPTAQQAARAKKKIACPAGRRACWRLWLEVLDHFACSDSHAQGRGKSASGC
ncbi:unnamed protein product [Prorocentrum cordatum]|uniref:Uncharacterized protein n=1 Tax=Prorocentrum cordatum TaxID=2364126 RepID=A0ABN9PFZ9_9DINO|nr:unnamed protein product [Polarella glacialis]